MELYQLSPYVRAVSHMTIHGPWRLAPRVLFDYELLYISGGKLTLRVGECQMSGVAGQLFLIPPGRLHTMEIPDGGSFTQMAVHFDAIWQEGAQEIPVCYRPMEQLTEEERVCIRPDLLRTWCSGLETGLALQRPERYEQLFQTVEQTFALCDESDLLICKGAFLVLLGEVFQELRWARTGVQGQQAETLQKIRSFLVEQAERQITMEDVGKAVRLSGGYASQLFKTWTGMTPLQFHRRIQMERADALLRDSELSVTQVAERLGFENIHAFSRAYKRQKGSSPQQWRSDL